jgi:hypothetical protein
VQRSERLPNGSAIRNFLASGGNRSSGTGRQAQKEFIQVAVLADFDPQVKARAAELREEMKRASQAIAKDPARMYAAEREGFAPQVRNFVHQAEQERGREKDREAGKDEGLER